MDTGPGDDDLCPAAVRLWNLIEDLCERQYGRRRPIRLLERKTGLRRATLSDWFSKRYVPDLTDIDPLFRLLSVADPTLNGDLRLLWKAASGERERATRTRPAPAPADSDSDSDSGSSTPPITRRLVFALAAVSLALALLAFLVVWRLLAQPATTAPTAFTPNQNPIAGPTTDIRATGTPTLVTPSHAPASAAATSTTRVPPTSPAAGPPSSGSNGSCVLRPNAAAGEVRHRCSLALRVGYSADLDSLEADWGVVKSSLGYEHDVAFTADGLRAQLGTDAQLAYVDQADSLADCQAATQLTDQVPATDLRRGVHLCATTADDRTALLVVTSDTSSGPNSVVHLTVTVWGRDPK